MHHTVQAATSELMAAEAEKAKWQSSINEVICNRHACASLLTICTQIAWLSADMAVTVHAVYFEQQQHLFTQKRLSK